MRMVNKNRVMLVVVMILSSVPFAFLRAEDRRSSVSNRIAAAKSVALSLEADSSKIASTARKGAGVRITATQTHEIEQHIDTARETVRELQEVEAIASPGQKAVIGHISPLLQDLAHNAESMLKHLNAGPKKGRRQVTVDYLSAHEEIANHIVREIANTIDTSEQKR